MLGLAAMADTRWQLKQEIGVPATLPQGPQLVSNDTAHARIPTLRFQCNRPDPLHVTGQMAIRPTLYAKLCCLQDMPNVVVCFPERDRDLSHLQSVQPGSEINPASYAMPIGNCPRPDRIANHST